MTTVLPAFEAKLRVRERQHPKLYWVDPGLARAAKRQLGPVAAEERGPLFEGLVLTILRAHNGISDLFDEVSYWAPAQARQTEVDFLLRRGLDADAGDSRPSTSSTLWDSGRLQAKAFVRWRHRRRRCDTGVNGDARWEL